nr:uncharacterized protein LOC128688808 [Cherax quadricarinatus]
MSWIRVVVVGGKAEVKEVLLHHSFRNTLHASYLAIYGDALNDSPCHSRLRKTTAEEVSEVLFVYRRCLYCNKGEADIRLLPHWNLSLFTQTSDHLFHEQFHNFMGHTFRISSLNYFPYMDYKRDRDGAGTTVTPSDCLDARLLSLFADRLNFSFDIREQPERSYGALTNGGFTGMVGQLQREETDLCLPMGPLSERVPVMEFQSAYKLDAITIVSLKPTLLPQHLSILRPFSRK